MSALLLNGASTAVDTGAGHIQTCTILLNNSSPLAHTAASHSSNTSRRVLTWTLSLRPFQSRDLKIKTSAMETTSQHLTEQSEAITRSSIWLKSCKKKEPGSESVLLWRAYMPSHWWHENNSWTTQMGSTCSRFIGCSCLVSTNWPSVHWMEQRITWINVCHLNFLLMLLTRNYMPWFWAMVLSKSLEKIVFNQLITFLDANWTLEVFQSGFRKHHSTETTSKVALSKW